MPPCSLGSAFPSSCRMAPTRRSRIWRRPTSSACSRSASSAGRNWCRKGSCRPGRCRRPAGRDVVVEHSYQPATGGTVVAQLADPEHWDSEGAQRTIRRYCVDRSFLAAVRRQAQNVGHGSAFDELWVSYILRTGASWRSPIRDFRLVVDKGDPRNLLSFCAEGVRRIDATRFEVRRRNWRPDRDLDILVMRPLSQGE